MLCLQGARAYSYFGMGCSRAEVFISHQRTLAIKVCHSQVIIHLPDGKDSIGEIWINIDGRPRIKE